MAVNTRETTIEDESVGETVPTLPFFMSDYDFLGYVYHTRSDNGTYEREEVRQALLAELSGNNGQERCFYSSGRAHYDLYT